MLVKVNVLLSFKNDTLEKSPELVKKISTDKSIESRQG